MSGTLKERNVMHAREDRRPRARKQAGFALILAILSLMLLTFLGLTLAATTSTELQIATNYRWSQQALYNAEAGLQAAKLLLAQIAAVNGNFTNILPTTRAGTWSYGVTGAPGGPPVPVPAARSGLRDYERMGCADRAGVGYGLVLTSPAGSPQPGNYQDISTYMASTLNGAFTIWVRRELTSNPDGTFSDSTSNFDLVVTAEGIAPYQTQTNAIARANQARRTLELGLSLLVNQGNRCQGLAGQEGLGPSGDNFDPCSPLTGAGVGNAFGGALTERTGVQ
ncbi:MAG TPA: PilX N-terminal domain-containing pilus assembly protein [Vicinamibacterales bacterium]|nr:PilX N-terminal domain-containing pilus assembly protein [Vicinamibacterales bacterium]